MLVLLFFPFAPFLHDRLDIFFLFLVHNLELRT